MAGFAKSLKRVEKPTLAMLRTIGRLAVAAPRPPRASGGYGFALRGGLTLQFLIGIVVAWLAHPAVGVGIMLAERFIRRARDAGVAVLAWTINEPAEIHRLLDHGVAGINTDTPTVLKSVLEERGERV